MKIDPSVNVLGEPSPAISATAPATPAIRIEATTRFAL